MFFVNLNNKEKRETFEIGQPNTGDINSIIELQKQVVSHMNTSGWYQVSTPEEIEQAVNDNQNYLCLSVKHEKKLVAFAYVILNPDIEHNLYCDLKENGIDFSYDSDDYAIFETSFVSPEYRGYGLQSFLIKALLSWTKLIGKKAICATIHPDNIYSERNFVKNGYVNITEQPLNKYGNKRNYFIKL